MSRPVVYWKPGFSFHRLHRRADPTRLADRKRSCNHRPVWENGSPPTGGVQTQTPFLRLPSEQAQFVCGSVLFVDGGHDAMLRPDEF